MTEAKVLPRFFGIKHWGDRSLEKAKDLIKRLPTRSKVGLEMDIGHPQIQARLPELVKRHGYGERNTYFGQLARFAENLGHTVVWLDRSYSLLPPSLLADFEALAKTLESAETEPEGSPKRLKDWRALRKIRSRMDWRGVMLSKWRSGIMSRFIRRTDWKETDVAITGTGHAHNLCEIFEKPVEQYIGDYADAAQKEKEIREAMEVQKFLGRRLELNRRNLKRWRAISDFFKKIGARFRRKK